MWKECKVADCETLCRVIRQDAFVHMVTTQMSFAITWSPFPSPPQDPRTRKFGFPHEWSARPPVLVAADVDPRAVQAKVIDLLTV